MAKCPSTDEWINKKWYVYTVGYYLAIKNELLKRTTKQVDIEKIMLGERNQSRRTTHCIISFLGNVQNRQIHKDRVQLAGCLRQAHGGGG